MVPGYSSSSSNSCTNQSMRSGCENAAQYWNIIHTQALWQKAFASNSEVTAEKSNCAHRKEVLNAKDKPKHAWYCHSYSKNFKAVKRTWEKADRKKERKKKKSLLAFNSHYLNEIQHTLTIFRAKTFKAFTSHTYPINRKPGMSGKKHLSETIVTVTDCIQQTNIVVKAKCRSLQDLLMITLTPHVFLLTPSTLNPSVNKTLTRKVEDHSRNRASVTGKKTSVPIGLEKVLRETSVPFGTMAITGLRS
ncbi:hypothetical protein Anapl_16182 [Anas platyrhynchos]|uniref:Uncharacterized protein n=1 Tax=Anas platyrhynchos TaxID=8839 RepID=R0JJT3_ANAPL|nr:hypothetical protein Anapl_16182 [Anas platyrhynchos]